MNIYDLSGLTSQHRAAKELGMNPMTFRYRVWEAGTLPEPKREVRGKRYYDARQMQEVRQAAKDLKPYRPYKKKVAV